MNTIHRAIAAARDHGYKEQQVLVLMQMVADADHDTGENCITSLAALHRAAGYEDDGGRHKSAERARDRLRHDGVVRLDFVASGIGQLWTVCPLPGQAWSGKLSEKLLRNPKGRSIARVMAHTPDMQDVRGSDAVAAQPSQGTPDSTPDRTPDTQDVRRPGGPRGPEDHGSFDRSFSEGVVSVRNGTRKKKTRRRAREGAHAREGSRAPEPPPAGPDDPPHRRRGSGNGRTANGAG